MSSIFLFLELWFWTCELWSGVLVYVMNTLECMWAVTSSALWFIHHCWMDSSSALSKQQRPLKFCPQFQILEKEFLFFGKKVFYDISSGYIRRISIFQNRPVASGTGESFLHPCILLSPPPLNSFSSHITSQRTLTLSFRQWVMNGIISWDFLKATLNWIDSWFLNHIPTQNHYISQFRKKYVFADVMKSRILK